MAMLLFSVFSLLLRGVFTFEETLTPLGETYENRTLDFTDAIKKCNESIPLDMSWWREFNNSGSFFDELKTEPKCFMSCVLETTEILDPNNRKFNVEAAAAYFASMRNRKLDDMNAVVNRCVQTAETEDEKCDHAYVFAKCIVEELSRRFRSDIIAEL